MDVHIWCLFVDHFWKQIVDGVIKVLVIGMLLIVNVLIRNVVRELHKIQMNNVKITILNVQFKEIMDVLNCWVHVVYIIVQNNVIKQILI